jgi:transcriptional regulator with XRE-family HTH domain
MHRRPEKFVLGTYMHMWKYPRVPASKFKHNLARLRKHLKLTQADVAKLVGCARITIQAIELGKFPLSEKMATKLQGALGVPQEWLLKAGLKSPIPEPLRAYQGGDANISYQYRLGVANEFWQAVSILKRLKTKAELELFRLTPESTPRLCTKPLKWTIRLKAFSQRLKISRALLRSLKSRRQLNCRQDGAEPGTAGRMVARAAKGETAIVHGPNRVHRTAAP